MRIFLDDKSLRNVDNPQRLQPPPDKAVVDCFKVTGVCPAPSNLAYAWFHKPSEPWNMMVLNTLTREFIANAVDGRFIDFPASLCNAVTESQIRTTMQNKLNKSKMAYKLMHRRAAYDSSTIDEIRRRERVAERLHLQRVRRNTRRHEV